MCCWLSTWLQNYQYCWVVDPLDGTKEFIKRNGEFTVMIGLVQVNNSSSSSTLITTRLMEVNDGSNSSRNSSNSHE
jgi:3'-phosphoadenosine 5'-phosphosulfate (PAPS) 3'-phosphatase